MPPHRNKI